MKNRKDVIAIDVQQPGTTYIEDGPGAGIVLQFEDTDGQAYIVAGNRPNPDSGVVELQTSFGGGFAPEFLKEKGVLPVGSFVSDSLIEIITHKIRFETLNVFKKYMDAVSYKQQAFIHNEVHEDWSMSYLTATATVHVSLDELKQDVAGLNQQLSELDKTADENKFRKKYQFGIYKYSDVVALAKDTHQQPDDGNKPVVAITNYLNGNEDRVIVFDDIATADLAIHKEQQAEVSSTLSSMEQTLRNSGEESPFIKADTEQPQQADTSEISPSVSNG